MAFWIFSVLTALLALFTFLSLLPNEGWWVRATDFPRLQLVALAALLTLAELILLDRTAPLSWLLIGVGLLCMLYQAWWIFPYTRLAGKEVRSAGPSGADNRIRIMGANVLTPNRNARGLLEMVETYDPDVLVAVETDDWWQEQLDVLEAGYPYTAKCPLDNLYGMLVYSRLPLDDVSIQYLVQQRVPSVHARATLPSGRKIQLHFIHPAPPSPTENELSTERDAELVVVGKTAAKADYPVIVTGDLNDVAWSHTTRLFRKVSGLLDPRVGRGMFNTFNAQYPFIRWPLDHLFHSDDFTLVKMQRLKAFGSDHFPILVELALEPSRGKEQDAPESDAEDREWANEKAEAMGVRKEDVHRPGE